MPGDEIAMLDSHIHIHNLLIHALVKTHPEEIEHNAFYNTISRSRAV